MNWLAKQLDDLGNVKEWDNRHIRIDAETEDGDIFRGIESIEPKDGFCIIRFKGTEAKVESNIFIRIVFEEE